MFKVVSQEMLFHLAVELCSNSTFVFRKHSILFSLSLSLLLPFPPYFYCQSTLFISFTMRKFSFAFSFATFFFPNKSLKIVKEVVSFQINLDLLDDPHINKRFAKVIFLKGARLKILLQLKRKAHLSKMKLTQDVYQFYKI